MMVEMPLSNPTPEWKIMSKNRDKFLNFVNFDMKILNFLNSNL